MCGNVSEPPPYSSPNFQAYTTDSQYTSMHTVPRALSDPRAPNGKPLRAITDQVPPPPDTTVLKKLESLNNYATDPTGVDPHGDVDHISFADAYLNLSWADEDPAPGFAQAWTDVYQGIQIAVDQFNTGLAAADSSQDSWQGDTHKAVTDNVNASLQIPKTLSTFAQGLSALAATFSTTMAASRNAIVPNLPLYNTLLAAYPEHHDYIVNQYNSYAQKALAGSYTPGIEGIDKNNPRFPTESMPAPGTPPDLSQNTGDLLAGGKMSGLGSVGGAGALPAAAFLPPSMPNLGGMTSIPTTSGIPTDPTSALASSPMSGLQGLSNLASPLQSALGAATNAARPPGGIGGLGAAGGARGLPKEGALGLGPKGSARGGGGGGAGPRGASIGKPPTAPATAVSSAGSRGAPVSRAGLMSGPGGSAAGAPGAGAPGGGQRPGAEGGQHQANKALRKKMIIGSAEAVVAVLGEAPRTDTPPKPDGS